MKVRYLKEKDAGGCVYLESNKIYEVEDTETLDGILHYFVLDEQPDDDGLKDFYPYPAELFETIEE